MDLRGGGDAVRRTVRRRSLLWVAGSVVGTAVIALPDTGPRIFSFSQTHGPSAPDLIGVVIVLATWLPVPVLLCSRHRPFRGAAGRLALALMVLGLAGLAVTIRFDLGAWYLVPVALLVGIQVVGLRLLWVRAGTASPARPAADAPG
ncbi:MAG TPA: hypothetical protein VHF92_01845 [Geodermatophilus sp.]|nr:hypothetical protein [Geodermatophilus sp.]